MPSIQVVHSFIHYYLSSANHMPSRVLGTGNMILNNRVNIFAFMELSFWRRIDLTSVYFGALPQTAVLDVICALLFTGSAP